MGTPSYKNRVGMTVTGTPGTGTITLNAAETGYQTFASAYGANANVDILIEEGSAWEIARDCTYTHSGTTVSRGTLEASSTGSALSLTSAAKVYVIHSAARMTQQISNTNSIDGLLCGYSASTTAAISAGYCWIEGVRYAQAADTTLSLSSGNEIGASSLAADKLLYIYAYNNAGTLAYKWDLRSSTSDDPLFSEEWQYWYHPSEGTDYRLIGVLRTLSGSATLSSAINVVKTGKRNRTYISGGFEVILNVTGTTEGSIALAAYTPKNGNSIIGFFGAGDTTAAGIVQGSLSTITGVDSSTNLQMVAKGYVSAASNTIAFGQSTIACESTDTLYAKGATATNYVRFNYVGFGYEV